MRPDLEALARQHALSPALVTAVAALLEQRDSGTIALEPQISAKEVEPPPGDAGVGSEGKDAARAPALLAGRYEDLGPLGSGGMGEVRRVRDPVLRRVLAMKLVHERFLWSPAALERFVEEARATAQLQHPGIVPVHDLGCLPDGRLWFTMKEVRGRTLDDVIEEVHAASGDDWSAGPSGWTFRRLTAAFLAICNAVAYAHDRGVIHRDLKPANTMVGDHGEVYVLDWGLVKLVAGAEEVEDGISVERAAEHRTRLGEVTGTPAYMPPEQARGEIGRMDARSDVYALGAILYTILVGRPPYGGRDALAQVLAGPPPSPETRSRRALPVDLVAACARAMARDPAGRFPSAAALAGAVEAWLDGARRREQALEEVERALAGVEDAAASRARAVVLRAEAEALREGVAAWEAEERKAASWAAEDEAAAAERAAELREVAVDEGLQAALRIAPDLPEALAALAERYRARHAAAEATFQRNDAVKAEARLRGAAASLPDGHPVRARVAAYLEGNGRLTLVTDPPGAEVLLYRYVERNRRLVDVFDRSLGVTPLREVTLPMGRYLCRVRHPDREEVRYPVEVTREGHWDGVAPGDADPSPVWLPPRGWLGPGEVYVPGGWFRLGGDPDAVDSFPAARAWCPPFVMHRFAVTHREYIAFLDALVAAGREAEALAHAPREFTEIQQGNGSSAYGYANGRFHLAPDNEGELWGLDWPVFLVDWHGARAYLDWEAARTGRPWRLPGQLEWEKAARGVDGRFFPWGDFVDPSWCQVLDGQTPPPRPAPVDSRPVDESPTGVRGLAGNMRSWCLDPFDPAAPLVVAGRVRAPEDGGDVRMRAYRGGWWGATTWHIRSASRFRGEPASRFVYLGFRGVYPVDPGAK